MIRRLDDVQPGDLEPAGLAGLQGSAGQKVLCVNSAAVGPRTRELETSRLQAWLADPSRPSPLNTIFLSPCFVPFIILFDVVDVWIGDWWMGGLML